VYKSGIFAHHIINVEQLHISGFIQRFPANKQQQQQQQQQALIEKQHKGLWRQDLLD
jgi:endonuclease YncB( thermonuclease family)